MNDLEDLKEELEEDEYEQLKKETVEQIKEFEVFLQNNQKENKEFAQDA